MAEHVWNGHSAPQDAGTRWAQGVRDYAACKPTWRSVPGGRALHAFMDGSARPLCGVEAPRWRDHTLRWGFQRRPEHRECARLAGPEVSRRLAELFERQRRELGREERHDG